MELRGRVGVVTGAASGIGRALHEEGLEPLRRRCARLERAILERKR